MKFINYKGQTIPVKSYLISTNELPAHEIIDRHGIFVICRETATGELFSYGEHKPITYGNAERSTE